jgi:hypothetical protein
MSFSASAQWIAAPYGSPAADQRLDDIAARVAEIRAAAEHSALVGCGCDRCADQLALLAHGGHIDHLPGADYHGLERVELEDGRGVWAERQPAPTAPAPRHTVALYYSPGERTDLLGELRGERRDVIDAPELLRRIRRAADRWVSGGYWAREDCASYVIARVLGELSNRTDYAPPADTGRPSDVLAWIDAAPLRAADVMARQIPAVIATPAALKRRVQDWANREEARRMAELASDRTDADAESDDDMSGEELSRSAPAADVNRRAAWALDREPARRAAKALSVRLGAGELGGVWEAIYCLLRDIDTGTGATELGVEPAAMRQRVSRGARAIRKSCPTPGDLRSALDIGTDDRTGEAKRRAERGLWRACAILNAPHIPADWGDRTSATPGELAERRDIALAVRHACDRAPVIAARTYC